MTPGEIIILCVALLCLIVMMIELHTATKCMRDGCETYTNSPTGYCSHECYRKDNYDL